MKFLVPNYSFLQNPWLRGYGPQIPVLPVLCPQLNLLKPPPPKKKFLGTPLTFCMSVHDKNYFTSVNLFTADYCQINHASGAHCIFATSYDSWSPPASTKLFPVSAVMCYLCTQYRASFRNAKQHIAFLGWYISRNIFYFRPTWQTPTAKTVANKHCTRKLVTDDNIQQINFNNMSQMAPSALNYWN